MFVQYLFGGPEGISPARGDKLRLPQAHGKMKTALSDGFHFGGPEGIRTLDLSDANRTLSQLSYGPVYEVFGDVNCLPATELDYRKRGAITEPLLLPAELWAHIGHFPSKKVMKNGFSGYSILRENHGKPD